jgi:hypothetical protein
LPRISSTTRRTFRGDILNHFVCALLCMAFSLLPAVPADFIPALSADSISLD